MTSSTESNFKTKVGNFLNKMLGTDPTKKDDVQSKEVLAYSVAGLGQNIICQLVTTFFMLFMTDVAGVSATWLAWMFLAARLFDALNDPVMGSIVEMTRTRQGKMRPYLKYSPIPIAILTVLLFVNLPVGETGKFAFGTVIYLLWGIAYTSVDVPYWGLASSMTSDTEKRNTILTVARLFCTIGSGAVSVFIPIIIGDDTSIATQRILYPIVALVCVLIAVPTFWVGYKGTKERFYDAETDGKFTLIKNLKLLGKNKPALLIILVGVLGSLRTIYMTTAVYYAKYNLQNFNLAGVIFLLVVPGGLAATLLTPVLSKRFGKKTIFIWSHIIGGALLVLLYIIGLPTGTSKAAQIAFYIIIILAGVPSGFSNIMTYSMIADSIDYLEDKTGERAEAFCFSLQTFISKIGMAMTAFVTLMVLGEYGYDASLAEEGAITEEVWNSPEFQQILGGNWMATTLLCGVSMLACAIPLFFYTFTEKKQKEAVARVLARKIVAGDPNPTVYHEFVETVAVIDPVKREEALIQVAQIFGLSTVEELMVKVEELKNVSDAALEEAQRQKEAAIYGDVIETTEVEEEVVEQVETKDGTVDEVEVKEEVEVTEVKSDDEEQKSDDDKKE